MHFKLPNPVHSLSPDRDRSNHRFVAALLGVLAVAQVALLGCGGGAPADTSTGAELAREPGAHTTAATPPAGGSKKQVTLGRIGDGPEFEPPLNKLQSLKGIKPPEPVELDQFVRDRNAAIALGKAFFWDMQAGSDGQACASCHFHAGADSRTKNQLSPGLNNTLGAPTNQTFNPTASGGAGGPNYTLKAADYPFHKLANIADANSDVMFDTDDVTSSQGVFRRDFVSVAPDADGNDTCTSVPDFFQVGGTNTRRNEPRNTPTILNAAFFHRSFWDGRANNVFNGVNPFGARDKDARVYALQGDGTAQPIAIRLDNSSAASQAVGPTLSGFEMSCAGRGFADVGRKLLRLKPLGMQEVSTADGVLGPLRDASGVGLSTTYDAMIKQAFDVTFWGASQSLPSGFTQMEGNFSLFWGLSIMLYEGTLVTDDAPIDRYLDGDKTALTPQQVYGKALFEGQARCINCHHGPVATTAAFDTATVANSEFTEVNSLERMAMGDGKIGLYDNGFYNLGVRPTGEDLGVGGSDPWGNPLSLAREAKMQAGGQPVPDTLVFDRFKFKLQRGLAPQASERDVSDGCFKTPSLRNVELTGPYFHNGGQGTLMQVVEFYNRGGDRRGGTTVRDDGGDFFTYGKDSTAFGANETNMDTDIQRLGLSQGAKDALVAFLKAFTDDRVRWEKAPFDHPQLRVASGAAGDEKSLNLLCKNGELVCSHVAEEYIVLPAVGKDGLGVLGLPALKGFLE